MWIDSVARGIKLPHVFTVLSQLRLTAIKSRVISSCRLRYSDVSCCWVRHPWCQTLYGWHDRINRLTTAARTFISAARGHNNTRTLINFCLFNCFRYTAGNWTRSSDRRRIRCSSTLWPTSMLSQVRCRRSNVKYSLHDTSEKRTICHYVTKSAVITACEAPNKRLFGGVVYFYWHPPAAVIFILIFPY
jgi:hypothetical protein